MIPDYSSNLNQQATGPTGICLCCEKGRKSPKHAKGDTSFPVLMEKGYFNHEWKETGTSLMKEKFWDKDSTQFFCQPCHQNCNRSLKAYNYSEV